MPRTTTNQANLGIGQLADTLTELEVVYDTAVATPVLQETGGTLTSDGTEQDLYQRNAPESVFEPRVVLISLDDMVALDTTNIRVYYRLADGGGWLQFDYAQYVGIDGGLANNNKIIGVDLLPCRHGVRVTLEMTVGAATYVWSAVEEA
jgi:hypothetical protein